MIPQPGNGWVRLSPRKLLLDPVKALGQFLVPAVVAMIGLSSGDRGMSWWLLPLVVVGAVIFGAMPWLTTHYRLSETQFQLRSGVLNKRTSTAPLDRVRSVDLEASVLHRLLGLEKVQVGTGVDDERITLDALARDEATALRGMLLARRAATAAPDAVRREPGAVRREADAVRREAGAAGEVGDVAPPVESGGPAVPPTTLATIDWSWLRFAPFSLARLVLLAGAAGALSQFGDELPIWDEDIARSAWEWLARFTLVVVVPALLIGGLVLWTMLSVAGYVVQWWGFRLTRDQGALHLTSGLLTTRSITVEEARVRGVQLTEPILLRAVGGAELSTLATGVGASGVQQVLPPCPRQVAVSVGGDIVEHDQPLVAPLTSHGPVARRRAWLRQVRTWMLLPIALAWPVWRWDLSWGWWSAIAAISLVTGAAVGESSYRHLGHALTRGHLVAGSGDLARVRTVLETDGIIGWVVQQSWWQRRVGLATLVATTAAGAESVVVLDVPLERAVALADAAAPGMLSPFLA